MAEISNGQIAAGLVLVFLFGGGSCGGGDAQYKGDQIEQQIDDANQKFDDANLPSSCGAGGCDPGETPTRNTYRPECESGSGGWDGCNNIGTENYE